VSLPAFTRKLTQIRWSVVLVTGGENVVKNEWDRLNRCDGPPHRLAPADAENDRPNSGHKRGKAVEAARQNGAAAPVRNRVPAAPRRTTCVHE
jgi:hypothetical protein